MSWNDLWIVAASLMAVGLIGLLLFDGRRDKADGVHAALFGLLCLGMLTLFAWGAFIHHPYVPPAPNEVCAERGGVRQVAPSTGWGGGPYVVCMNGYSTEDVLA